MNTIICTLYEKHYHYGVAALLNSLAKYGFEGDFYIGYRGELPFWAKPVVETIDFTDKADWKSIKKVAISDRITLHFILLETDYHLSNYKPTFMCDLWESLSEKPDGIFYFDPDIVIKCNWVFF
ncbi:hypothetical protein FACS1894182_11360 [Bacteroidia bacterium]|nr:hypothetical protein FACS1894182_11360 [Bacteroidia bacterium]